MRAMAAWNLYLWRLLLVVSALFSLILFHGMPKRQPGCREKSCCEHCDPASVSDTDRGRSLAGWDSAGRDGYEVQVSERRRSLAACGQQCSGVDSTNNTMNEERIERKKRDCTVGILVFNGNETTSRTDIDDVCIVMISIVAIAAVLIGILAVLITRRSRNAYLKKDELVGEESCDAHIPLSNPEQDDSVAPELVPLLKVRPLSKRVPTDPLGAGNLLTCKKLGQSAHFDAFSKPTFHHFFEFRRDQTFRQSHTVCPATVSLASHFASGTYGQPGSLLELQKEGVRLASFRDFPVTAPVSAMRLAQAGFHYTGERDAVKCFSCGVTHQGWSHGDRPSLVHARINPNCPLVRGSDTANLPLPLPVTTRPDFAAARSGVHSGDSGYASHSFGSSSASAAPSSSPGVTYGSAARERLQEDSGG